MCNIPVPNINSGFILFMKHTNLALVFLLHAMCCTETLQGKNHLQTFMCHYSWYSILCDTEEMSVNWAIGWQQELPTSGFARALCSSCHMFDLGLYVRSTQSSWGASVCAWLCMVLFYIVVVNVQLSVSLAFQEPQMAKFARNQVKDRTIITFTSMKD